MFNKENDKTNFASFNRSQQFINILQTTSYISENLQLCYKTLITNMQKGQNARGGGYSQAKCRNLLECVTMTWTNKRSFYSLLIILEWTVMRAIHIVQNR